MLDGDEIFAPVTIGDLAAEGRLLWCYCCACGYEREVEPRSLGLGDDQPVPTAGQRLKCSQCGSREIETKQQLHVEPLEVMRARYRGRKA
jgi:Zn finger protein HypA/HybF involved in hydrogenase expression